MRAAGRERRAKPRRVGRKADPCQICPTTWDCKARPQAVVTIAGYRLCERHLRNLIALLEGK
jgi:hypothetical protein